MPFNGSDIVTDPVNTTFSPFTELFESLGTGMGATFWLFPLSVIAVALYVKTRSVETVSLYMITSGALLGSGGIFWGATDMGLVFLVFASLGIASLFISLFWSR